MTLRRRCLLLFFLCLAPATASGQSERIEYYALDAVGSVRVVFDATGAVVGRMDYAPFGEELFNGLFVPAERFAELKRDGEAGLDYAEARLYQSRSGRFNAPDPIFGALFEPQRWNRYSYGLNNPGRYTDPNGLNPRGPANCSNPKFRQEFKGPCAVEDAIASMSGWIFTPIEFGSSQRGTRGTPFFPGQKPKPDPTPGPTSDPDPKPDPTPDPKPDPKVDTCGGPSEESPVYYLSGGGVFAPLLGPEMTGGIYYVPKTGEVGVFGSRALAIGISAGLSVEAGGTNQMRNFRGEAINLNAGVGGPVGVSVTITKDSDNRTFTGGSAGVGPFGQQWGVHASRPTTSVFKLGTGPCLAGQ